MPTAAASEGNAAERQPTIVDLVRELLRDGPGDLSAAHIEADLAAHNIMRKAVLESHSGLHTEVADYVKAIGAKVTDNKALTVHEHTAVSYLLRCGMFDPPEPGAELQESKADAAADADIKLTLQGVLAHSWKKFTGKERKQDKLTTRLPKMVLRKASRKDRVYHAASFQKITGKRPSKAELAERRAESSMLRDYVPENQDVVLGIGALLATAFTNAGRWALGGAILQYVMYSVTENVLHEHIAHPKPGTVGKWAQKYKLPEGAGRLHQWVYKAIIKKFAKQVDNTMNAHTGVHHNLTYKESFTQRFDEKRTQEKVDAWIDKRFDDPAVAEKIKGPEDYATKLEEPGMIKIASTIAPQTLAFIATGAMLGAPAWMLVPTLISAALYPIAMGKGHPIYHVPVSEAKEKASAFMKKLRETRYISYSARNHWMHHNYQDANFNLSYPGADALLGQLMQPNLQDLFRMEAEDTLHY